MNAAVGQPMPVDTDYPNLRRLHSAPDIYLVKDFLSPDECDKMIASATGKGLKQSPVAYGGWTQDVGDLLRLLAVGPAVWLALIPELNSSGRPTLEVAASAIGTWLSAMVFFGVTALGWAKWRELNLQGLRTSTSITLEGGSEGAAAFNERAMRLLQLSSDETFEGIDVIRYEPGQVLKPHYDANREANLEDVERGGQVIATALVYLNDVAEGGRTRFGKLDLHVQPKRGELLLFFPADRNGVFDERTEHEGTQAVDEKWLGRIWVHQFPVISSAYRGGGAVSEHSNTRLMVSSA